MSVTFFMLGISKGLMSKQDTYKMDRVMAYTNDINVKEDKSSDKSKRITKPVGRYSGLIGSDRIDVYRLEALRADLPMTGEEWFLVKLLLPLFAAVAIGIISKNMIIGFVGWSFGVALIRIVTKIRIQKRLKAFTNQLNDALNIMSNSLRAGYSFLQSVNSVSREMPDPIAHEFRRLLKELSLGQEADKALKNLVARVESDDLALVVRAILIQKETGGNLAEILDTISTTIRDRVKIQGEIKTLTAQGRLSGMIVSFMPVVLIGIMYMINPEYISVLFQHPIGRMLLIGSFINEVIGMLLIRKIVSIEV